MSVIDKKILGANLCDMECTEKNATIHPETCVEQVLTAHSGTATLTDWLTYNENNPDDPLGGFEDYNGLRPWLIANYPHNTYTLPVATNSTLGGVKVGSGLSIDGNGVLSTTPTPTIDIATFDDAGIIKLGNGTRLVSNFGNNIITGETSLNTDFFPIRLDSNNRAGIAIPKSSYTPVQSDWLENDPTSNSYIINRPTIPTVNNKTITITQGENTYSFTLNQATDYSIQLNDGQTYELPAATSNTLGGIKLGYNASGSYRAVQLDENNHAYVDVTDENLKNHEITAINKEVYDEYGNHFDSYTVKCDLSNEYLKVVNLHDFTTETGGYNNTLTIGSKAFSWTKGEYDTDCYIGALLIEHTACKGRFEIIIQDTQKHTTEIHKVGFVVDTPEVDAFAWFTTLPWSIIARSSTSNHATLVYIRIPDSFVGSVIIKPEAVTYMSDACEIATFTYDGTNYTKYYWYTSRESTTLSVITTLVDSNFNNIVPGSTYQDHIVVPNPYNVWVDFFLDTEESLSVGDKFYDNFVNDKILHNISYKVKDLEARVAALERELLERNTQALAVETLPTE